MNTLFYIAAYSYTLDKWARFLVTATATDEALTRVENFLEGTYYAIHKHRAICETPTNTFTEI